MDSKRKNELLDNEFKSTQPFTILLARKSIETNNDVCILNKRGKKVFEDDLAEYTIRASELRKWGLSVDSLLIKEDPELEAYTNEIL